MRKHIAMLTPLIARFKCVAANDAEGRMVA